MDDIQIKALVETLIHRDEKTGDQAGGSGHMSFVDYFIHDIRTEHLKEKDQTKVTYEYSLSVESEFTIYPDNPPYETRYRKEIIIDRDGMIIQESDKETVDTGQASLFEEWDMVKGEILNLIDLFLLKIEWKYGDNGAPILYPPEFNQEEDSSGTLLYQCIITPDDGNGIPEVIETDEIFELPDKVREILKERYGMDDA